jgi:hypothetical protein
MIIQTQATTQIQSFITPKRAIRTSRRALIRIHKIKNVLMALIVILMNKSKGEINLKKRRPNNYKAT